MEHSVMASTIRLWQRDNNIINEAERSPQLTGQIARLHHFSSRKKAAERLGPLYRAGLLKRVPYFQPAKQGKPEFVYFTGTRPHPRTLAHTIRVAEVRVQLAEWLRTTTDYGADFYYEHEVQTNAGIIPDATILLRKADRTALIFVEVDNGSEPVTSTAGYSLAGKLRAYASYFDSGAYQDDFRWTGPPRGFQVALILPRARRPHVHQVIRQEHHDFVLVTTSEDFHQAFARPIWLTHDGNTVDVLGNRGDLTGDLVGDLVGPPIPTPERDNQ